jgi:tetratricopeptide (TPR) repeat protein
MNRTQGLVPALAAALVLGACASAPTAKPTQAAPVAANEPAKKYPPGLAQPSDNDFTRRVGLLLIKAEATKDTAQRAQDYQQAVQITQQGLQADSMNPKLWYQEGQAYAGAGDFAKADKALSRAQQIYPAYEPDINGEREQDWIFAFNEGVKAMQAGDTPGAINWLEKGQSIYDKRPEGLLNLASLYLRANEPDKAIQAYQDVLKIVNGPGRTEMDTTVTADWPKFKKMAMTNLPQIYASEGVEQFRAEHYDSAVADFQDALKINGYYRDALHNLAQALYLETSDLEGKEDSVSADQKTQIESQLRPLYDEFQKTAEKVRSIDPYNSNVLLLLARAYRGEGILATDSTSKKQWQDKALQVLQDHEQMPFQVTDLQVSMSDSAVDVHGNLENMSLPQGQSVVLKFTMLDADGNPAGTQQVTVTAPAKNASAPFELSVPVQESVLGWKYERVS